MTHIVDLQRAIKHALISVADKANIVGFARQLIKRGIEIIATGGTAKLLREHQISVIDVPTYTGFPEILDGRIKTPHPKIHGGLLARRGLDDDVLKQHAITPIDLLIVNLYPFTQTIASPHCTLEKAIEQIDVGGPSMLRAGAKNFNAVTVVVNPIDYSLVLQEMDTYHNSTTLSTRKVLAQKTFEHLSCYDAEIAAYLAQEALSSFTSELPITFRKKMDLRYGENPHQAAALYCAIPKPIDDLTEAQQLQGKPLSFNNLLDSDCAYRTVWEGQQITPTCVIVKHATPCGAAQGENQLIAYEKAYTTDPLSAFGGIIVFNSILEVETAKKIFATQFVEVIIAPDFGVDALTILKSKRNLRLLKAKPFKSKKTSYSFHSISGGLLVQQTDKIEIDLKELTVVSQRQPSRKELQDLYFAWQIVKHVKSNAIVCVKNTATLGIGSGQTSRVFAAKIAVMKAQEAGLSLKNAVMASDAFFPFSDGIEVAAQAGISAIIQPGGSIRDEEVIEVANKAGIAMIFTHQRHFRH
ncbi:MAG: bifunctional phosphoribosylaminoimidazolecarboxamide formyltransferase/IMP cyclohydrolase [Coxiella endosymbiont of Haemaphysalis qinghaiensis]